MECTLVLSSLPPWGGGCPGLPGCEMVLFMIKLYLPISIKVIKKNHLQACPEAFQVILDPDKMTANTDHSIDLNSN